MDIDDVEEQHIVGPGGLTLFEHIEAVYDGHSFREIAQEFNVSHDSVRKFAQRTSVNRFTQSDVATKQAIVNYMRSNIERQSMGYHEWKRMLAGRFGIILGVHTESKLLYEADPQGMIHRPILFRGAPPLLQYCSAFT